MENKDLDKRIHVLETELKTHEVQCEERWKTAFARLGDIEDVVERIESRIVLGGGATILFLAGLIVTLLMK